MAEGALSDDDFVLLASFRFALRRFQQFSEQAARNAGLTPQQHQALLAIRAAGDAKMLVGELADRLLLKAHSTTELLNRLEKAALVERSQVSGDRRQVDVSLTDAGEELLASLASVHRDELRRLRPMLADLITRL